MDTQEILNFVTNEGGTFAVHLVTAIAAWIIGRILIKLAVRALAKVMERSGKLDHTLSRYVTEIIGAALTIVLVLAILDIFGVKTTSFAALFAGAGLAIGAAWSGMLGNFAAGLFLQVLRPYKVGDFIEGGGTQGTVQSIGILATVMVTPDGVLATVGNNKIFSDTIKNYTALPTRQVACKVKVANGVNPLEAIERLRPVIAAIPNVATDPAPFFGISSFTPEGPVINVGPYTPNASYWQVFFDTNRAIMETFTAAGYPVPDTPLSYRVDQPAPVRN